MGPGVVGLAVALALVREGWSVTLAGDGGGASAAAAGMLAPASEAVLDGASAATASAWLAARWRWDAWAPGLRTGLDPSGALHLDDPDALDLRALAAERLGFAVERPSRTALLLPEDAVLPPASVLAALARAAAEGGVHVRRGRATVRDGRLLLDGAPAVGAVVIAAGWGSSGLAGAAPELLALRPIKGQLLRLSSQGASGPVIRGPDAYLAPHAGGWTVGATMEPGRDDLAPDADVLARLRAAATALRPELAGAPGESAVGVRAAVDDGAPLVGRSRSGVWLATGMRRNGWLLAPLVAEGMAAYLAGRDPDPALAGQARAWDPARIAPSQGAA